ncbi:hypothetical protein [Geitlerinema sp. PCC 9228]|uniref:hypothetical protein n=1 Tax=Geitlerinema sp. PCC 9228 TaxID=111611 RepID=UPI0011147FB5|nr:hypothetical protein [Geitlerinema sp. PCC 9228]
MSASAQPEPENKCSDCLFMRLTGTPVRSLWPWQKLIELNLTLAFGEQSQKLPAGEVSFGIKAGELRLTLKNGFIPYRKRELNNDIFELSIPKERQTSKSGKKKGSVKASAANSGELKGETIASREDITETKDKFKFRSPQITTKGSEENPAWEFEIKTGEPCIKGDIQNKKLATVIVKEQRQPCEIEATFQVSGRDIYISKGEGLWPSHITNRKTAIIEKYFIYYCKIKPKIKPYLSKHNLHFE